MDINRHAEDKTPHSIGEILSDAWTEVPGSKWPVWITFLVLIILSFVTQVIVEILLGINPKYPPDYYQYLVLPIAIAVVVAPLYAGATMVGIKRARGEKVQTKTGFQCIRHTGPLMLVTLIIAFGANVLIYILHINQVIQLIPNHLTLAAFVGQTGWIIVYILTLLAIPLVIDKGNDPWTAIQQSIRIIGKNLIRVGVVILLVYLLNLAAFVPLYLGSMLHPYAKFFGLVIMVGAMIWLVPYMFLIIGVIYRELAE